eukprot:scaffold69174_cov28-Tisochrysis_lutea.AAC.4
MQGSPRRPREPRRSATCSGEGPSRAQTCRRGRLRCWTEVPPAEHLAALFSPVAGRRPPEQPGLRTGGASRPQSFRAGARVHRPAPPAPHWCARSAALPPPAAAASTTPRPRPPPPAVCSRLPQRRPPPHPRGRSPWQPAYSVPAPAPLRALAQPAPPLSSRGQLLSHEAGSRSEPEPRGRSGAQRARQAPILPPPLPPPPPPPPRP